MKKETVFWILLGIFAVGFASWLMFHTFSYNSDGSFMLIATKAWSDFGAHIPLIRSFSLGQNFPPEYPLFPGEPIRYHFLFYFLVGNLEKAGLRIDWALNIPSILGFAGLIIGIALLSQKIFKDKRITLLSVLFFLFNGSCSWIRFFITHPPSVHTLQDIVTNTTFPSFAPWGDGDISAFWNLNIYTNQRHLGAAFSLALLFIGILLFMEKLPWKKQKLFLIPEIAILALLPYFHQPILIILAVCMLCYFVLFPKLRIPLVLIGTAGLLSIIPQIIPLLSDTKTIRFQPGYLITAPLSVGTVLSYWIQNIGLHFFLIPIGWLLAPTKVKKTMTPLFFLFLIPNLFQFSVEIAANHKFFNFYLLLGSMLSAYTLVRVYTYVGKYKLLQFFSRTFALTCGFFLIFSGIIDVFPVINDPYIPLRDIPHNEVATWIRDNTPPDAVFLNSGYFFHPASLAGRKIFQGWPYFTWSAGYKNTRHSIMKTIYESTAIRSYCPILQSYHIEYITVEPVTNDPNLPEIRPEVWKSQATPVYANEAEQYFIYATAPICSNK